MFTTRNLFFTNTFQQFLICPKRIINTRDLQQESAAKNQNFSLRLSV
jgi:hypothetical protein